MAFDDLGDARIVLFPGFCGGVFSAQLRDSELKADIVNN